MTNDFSKTFLRYLIIQETEESFFFMRKNDFPQNLFSLHHREKFHYRMKNSNYMAF